jgi:hypothetical protein
MTRTPPSRETELCWVTIAAWDPSLDTPARAHALVAAAGIHPATASSVAERPAPLILTAAPRNVAREIARALTTAGAARAMYPSTTAIRDIADPFRCTKLLEARDAPIPLFTAAPHSTRLPSRALNLLDLTLIIRARVRGTTIQTTRLSPDTGDFGDSTPGDTPLTSTKSAPISDLLDLYTADGPPIRIDGRRFSFALLGLNRGYSDGDNMTRLATFLAERAPAATIDLGFAHFHAPGLVRAAATRPLAGPLGLAGDTSPFTSTTRRDDTAIFEFYSPWRALVDRALRAATPRGQT